MYPNVGYPWIFVSQSVSLLLSLIGPGGSFSVLNLFLRSSESPLLPNRIGRNSPASLERGAPQQKEDSHLTAAQGARVSCVECRVSYAV